MSGQGRGDEYHPNHSYPITHPPSGPGPPYDLAQSYEPSRGSPSLGSPVQFSPVTQSPAVTPPPTQASHSSIPSLVSFKSPLMTSCDGGYDLTFVPDLDEKFECPICLMCLREPVQTECGHRFCRDCIIRSLRIAGPRCPIDNEALSDQKMFADTFAKREIMNLHVVCPFKGCDFIIELRKIESHLEMCQYGTIPCPHNCGLDVRRLSGESHIELLCPKRPITCCYCQLEVPRDLLERHNDVCPKMPIKCQHCAMHLRREHENQHLEEDCPKLLISCRFRNVGCMVEVSREEMKRHLQETTNDHMDLMARKLEHLDIGQSTARPGHSEGYDYGDYSGIPHNLESLAASNFAPSTKMDKLSDAKNGGLPSLMSFNSFRPLEIDSILLAQNPYELKQYLEDTHSYIHYLEERMKNMEKQFAISQQKCAQLDCVQRSMKDQMKGMMEACHFSRFCNGVFIWKLENFGKLRNDAVRGETSVKHSQGFYTSYYGYKLCIRVNINATDGIHGAYISLFVHFMKGDYDNILEWPFVGSITLSILDQHEDSLKRKHLKETLLSKRELAAFHRPKTSRNHKGFGYMEFAPLSVLESGDYIKNDVLYISVEVKK